MASTEYMESLRQFHERFELVANQSPTIVDKKTALLRVKVIISEAAELTEAIADEDIVRIFDGLLDLLYTTFGTGVSYGLPIEKGFRQVHENNMTKLGPDGKPLKDAAGKVIKPDGYKPVDLSWVDDQTYNDSVCVADVARVWQGSPITVCQLCHKTINKRFVDGKTSRGPWAIMCIPCFALYGRGLGEGSGQMYELQRGMYVKIKGQTRGYCSRHQSRFRCKP